eukprot:s7642_g2.t1
MLVQPSGRFLVAGLDEPLTSRSFFSSHWSATTSGRASVNSVIPLVCSCCICASRLARAKRLRRRSQGKQSSGTKGFFDDWACWDSFVAKLDLVEESLPSEFARRIGSVPSSSKSAGGSSEVPVVLCSASADHAPLKAIIESRVWLGQAPSAPVRRVRYVTVDAGPQLQAFNAVVYPAPSHGLQPVLGVDVLSFNSHKRQLFGVDWAPMLPKLGHIEERIAPYVRSIYDDFEAFRSAPGGKVYGDSPEFFSPYMFFSRPEGPEAISAGSKLWEPYHEVPRALQAVCPSSRESLQRKTFTTPQTFAMPEKPEDGSEVVSILALKRQEKKEENRRGRQSQLQWLMREVEIDWNQVVELMATEGLNPNIKEAGSGITSLHRAASAGQAEVLLWCIRTKAEVDGRTQLGRSALHYACECSRPRCVRLLLEHQADANLRTLSYLTPLHLACQANSTEVVSALLQDPKQVVDVDAEDTKRRSAEALSTNQQIHRLVRKYRAQLDERRKAQLVEQCLQRLFSFFDVNQDGMIHPEEWADSMTLLAEFFENHSDQSISMMFEEIDKDESGFIDWQEFKASYAELLQVINVPFRELMDTLSDVDRAILKEKLRLEREEDEASKALQAQEQEVAQFGEEEPEDSPTKRKDAPAVTVSAAGKAAVAMKRFRAPVVSPKAKAMSLRRVALRRHSDHQVAETAEEALALFAASQETAPLPVPTDSLHSLQSNPNEADDGKENVLPTGPDLGSTSLSALENDRHVSGPTHIFKEPPRIEWGYWLWSDVSSVVEVPLGELTKLPACFLKFLLMVVIQTSAEGQRIPCHVLADFNVALHPMAYRTVLSDSPVVDEVCSMQAQERQDAYDAWHAERDPALKVFGKMFGEEWTEDSAVE